MPIGTLMMYLINLIILEKKRTVFKDNSEKMNESGKLYSNHHIEFTVN